MENLVLCGGGVKGLAFLSTLKYLETTKNLKTIRNFYGTSVGAFISLLLVTTFSVHDIERLLFSLSPSTLLFSDISDMLENLTPQSIGATPKFRKLLESILSHKFQNPAITLRELHEQTKKTLHAIAVDMRQNIPVNINHLLFPDMPVVTAILASCALPGVFDPVPQNEFIFTDGGIHENYPIRFVPQSQLPFTIGLFIPEYNTTSHTTPWNISLPQDRPDDADPTQTYNPTFHYFTRLLQCFFSHIKQFQLQLLTPAQRLRTFFCSLPFQVDSSNFWITPEQRRQLSTTPVDPRITHLFPPPHPRPHPRPRTTSF